MQTFCCCCLLRNDGENLPLFVIRIIFLLFSFFPRSTIKTFIARKVSYFLLISKQEGRENEIGNFILLCIRKLHKIKRKLYIFFLSFLVMQNIQTRRRNVSKASVSMEHDVIKKQQAGRRTGVAAEGDWNFIVKIPPLFSEGQKSLWKCTYLLHSRLFPPSLKHWTLIERKVSEEKQFSTEAIQRETTWMSSENCELLNIQQSSIKTFICTA